MIRLLEEDAVTEVGCDVVGPARTFEEALQLIEKDRVDAALVDGTINGVPAYQFADALRRKNIPFAILTAAELYRPHGIPVLSFRGAVFVDKPFRDVQIIQALEVLLGNRAAK